MSSHAALAAGKETAIGQQYERGTQFTVTVSVGENVVPDVPFVNKGPCQGGPRVANESVLLEG